MKKNILKATMALFFMGLIMISANTLMAVGPVDLERHDEFKSSPDYSGFKLTSKACCARRYSSDSCSGAWGSC